MASRNVRSRGLMNELTSDLWLDIFQRVSVNDLLSLKAVCKTFHQLISSDWFVGMHLKDFTKYPKAPTTAFIISTNPNASNLNYDPEKRTIRVWHSKLLTLKDFWSGKHVIRRYRVIDSYLVYLLIQICDRLCLYNPLTRSQRFLPSKLSDFSWDPSCWKIAYDDVSEQYKVFCLKMMGNLVTLFAFEVRRSGYPLLCLKTARRVEVGPGGDDDICRTKGSVLVNGNVYWLVTNQSNRWGCIVSANVTTGEMKNKICSSTLLEIRPDYDNLFTANGTFYFVRSLRPYGCYDLQLWVLEGVESEKPSWMKKQQIPTSSILLRNSCVKTRALGVFGNILLIIILPKKQYYQYDLSRNKFEIVKLEGPRWGYFTELELIGLYFENLPVGFLPATIL